jgi:hypothetical protein
MLRSGIEVLLPRSISIIESMLLLLPDLKGLSKGSTFVPSASQPNLINPLIINKI